MSTAADVVTPSAEALYAAESAGRRAKKDAPVRHRFFVRELAGEPDPPMAHILRGGRGGRGGDVRFRLYLSLLWLVRDDPVLSFPARSWAALLGLDEPETKGARRVKVALRWLEDNDLIRLKRAPGHDSLVEVRDDAGTGQEYELPGAAYNRLRADPAAAKPHLYTRIPSALWTQGWMSILSGAAVAMLLVLLYETSRSNTTTVWFSPSLADLRYGLSEDTRAKGLLQLEQAGLVDVRRRSIAPDGFDYRKFRNVHTLQLDTLTTSPARLRATHTRAQLRRPDPADLVDEPFAAPTAATSR